MNFIKILFSACIAIFSLQLQADNCTHHPIGLSKIHDDKNVEITLAVAKVMANSSIEIAESEVRIDARALLLTDPLFKSNDKKLVGAIDVLTCTEGDSVFGMVKISEESVKQAREMKRQLDESLKNSPVPVPENLPNETEIKTEFERLMKQ